MIFPLLTENITKSLLSITLKLFIPPMVANGPCINRFMVCSKSDVLHVSITGLFSPNANSICMLKISSIFFCTFSLVCFYTLKFFPIRFQGNFFFAKIAKLNYKYMDILQLQYGKFNKFNKFK